MPYGKLSTAVALIIFNRPETTEKVFSAIAKAKPPKLLVVADGPRVNRAGEAERCAAARAIIKRVDWDCEVLTNYSETNLGCKNRVASGIDWVFEQVPEAIILEDDCLPDQSFFYFCEELLERYRDDKRISMIAGSNIIYKQFRPDNSYFYSRYSLIWGWATWRRAWKDYDISMSCWPERKKTGWHKYIGGRNFWKSEYWKLIFDDVYTAKLRTWDYQWLYTNIVMNRLCIVPAVNMVDNIGFGSDATHTTESPSEWIRNSPSSYIELPLTHPNEVSEDIIAKDWIEKAHFEIERVLAFKLVLFKIPFLKRVLRSARRFVRKN